MAKRLFDVVVALVALLLLSPVMLVAALGVRLSSRGPVLYRARRAGRGGRVFVMHKFRTMHARPQQGPAITGAADPRVFPFGALLRKLKIDELPQLYDVLRGEMSIVGPRPEDPQIVAEHYTPADRETLRVRPGLSSPGSLFYYMHGERLLTGSDPERLYAEVLLPVKLGVDREYLDRATFFTDLAVIFRTARVILRIGLGRTFPESAASREAHRRLSLLRAGKLSAPPTFPDLLHPASGQEHCVR